jgi:hypothetical protein
MSDFASMRKTRPGSPRSIPLGPIAKLVAAVSALAALAGVLAPGALGANTGTLSVQIPTIAYVKSITLSTTGLGCNASGGGALGYPNNKCQTGQYTITNGTAPSTILVQGANATPSATPAGQAWSLVPSPLLGGPGKDQYTESTAVPTGAIGSSLTNTTPLGTTAACDQSFPTGTSATGCGSGGGAASPGQVVNEGLTLVGPSASTDPGTSFSTTVTYTAT